MIATSGCETLGERPSTVFMTLNRPFTKEPGSTSLSEASEAGRRTFAADLQEDEEEADVDGSKTEYS
jgi:hypothetical protein